MKSTITKIPLQGMLVIEMPCLTIYNLNFKMNFCGGTLYSWLMVISQRILV